ncbi:site-specific DNA-methyltransferase [Clostridium estertheticum]|uniref:site-specific DNA-methyltransferase n=1 Tax=Clostridium estertheticum TaxID=238834 RepID=UPI0013EE6A5B|nr:site-specific DNA-methyltransferase [Clostridium estertheticum]MBZ9608203.1 site-specific DNA-methyltransferase [Clostridium estertheticum]
MEKLGDKSMNIVAENIIKMKGLFPEVFCEDKIDFEKLKEVLGEYTEDKEERYSFNWKGKSKSIRLAQTSSTGTLRPCKEESKNWDATENLYIEGDNLEVLKLLQKTYHSKVKMIYIDPPYNTGNDFVYPDDYRDSIKNYLEITGQVDAEGRKLGTNSEASGRYHTDWLNMMYPRLKLARNLLSDDGVIFISINDIEFGNLKKLCDELFGENNFVDIFLWTKTSTPPSLSNKSRKTVEFILCYEKAKNNYKYYGSDLDNGDAPLLNTGNPQKTLISPPKTINFTCLSDGSYGSGQYEKVEILNDIVIENGQNLNEVILTGEFKWSSDTLKREINDGTNFIIKSEKFSIRFQRKDNDDKFKTPNNFFADIELNKSNGVGTNESAVKELNCLGLKGCFDYPKPTSLLKKLIKMITYDDKSCIILDFFSASATTANAVIQLNAEDGGKCKYIMAQLPESTDKKDVANMPGYKNICEIGKERIRRVGEKILKENKDKEGIENLDIGFKVFKLDSSNIKKWNVDGENIEISIDDMIDNFVPNRTEEDIVYEIMLKYGIDLTYPVEMRNIADKKVFSIGVGALFICIDDEITLEVVEGIVKFKEELNPEITRVVFKDNGFKNDSVKTNAIHILRRNNIQEIMSI